MADFIDWTELKPEFLTSQLFEIAVLWKSVYFYIQVGHG